MTRTHTFIYARIWLRIAALLYPVNIYLCFLRILIGLHIFALTNFTLPIVITLFVFFPIVWDTQKRWLVWGTGRIKQVPNVQKIVAIILIAASFSLNFASLTTTFSMNTWAGYIAVGFVSVFLGVGREEQSNSAIVM